MSDMQRNKVKLRKVLDFEGNPVNIQDWLEGNYSVYMDQEVTQEVAFDKAHTHFQEEDWEFDYYLFDDQLWMIVHDEEIDVYGYVKAEFSKEDGSEITVDAMFYNGGGNLSEVVADSLKKLENEL